jgi:hypothetical protein
MHQTERIGVLTDAHANLPDGLQSTHETFAQRQIAAGAHGSWRGTNPL